MSSEDLIKKWLDGTLDEEEKRQFEISKEFNLLVKMLNSAEAFKAPEYDVESELSALEEKKNPQLQEHHKFSWLKPLLQVAAVLTILAVSTFYFYINQATIVTTDLAEKTHLFLPDSSRVELNASSSLVFKERQWSNNRFVDLEGEAYFRVAHGSVFDVKTVDAIVTVVGTSFNVKQRSGYFEVACFEGVVQVNSGGQITRLSQGHAFRLIDGQIIKDGDLIETEPSWLNNESAFVSIPFRFVMRELERQYQVKVVLEQSDPDRLFTGKFTHKDLELALQTITIPMNLDYKLTAENQVILSSKGD